jgi:hypothetical protein
MVWCGAKPWGVQHTHQQPLGGCGNTWIWKSQLDSLWFRSSFRTPEVLKVCTGSSGPPYRNFRSRPPELPVWYLTSANSSLWVSGFTKRPIHPPLGQLGPFNMTTHRGSSSSQRPGEHLSASTMVHGFEQCIMSTSAYGATGAFSICPSTGYNFVLSGFAKFSSSIVLFSMVILYGATVFDQISRGTPYIYGATVAVAYTCLMSQIFCYCFSGLN